MKLIDYLLLAAVIALLAFAVRLARGRSKHGGCHGCSEENCCASAHKDDGCDCCSNK